MIEFAMFVIWFFMGGIAAGAMYSGASEDSKESTDLLALLLIACLGPISFGMIVGDWMQHRMTEHHERH